jgi:hypothetical protein
MRVRIKDKIWDKEALTELLNRNDEAVGRALVVVFNNQTADEKAAFVTKHNNGEGFTGRDAEWLTDIARKWLIYRRWASPRQLAAVRKAIVKYHRQILEHMADHTPGAERIVGRLKAAADPAPTQGPGPILLDPRKALLEGHVVF